jgi:hypothetical protein
MKTTNVKHAAQPYDYRGSNFHWQAPDVSKFVHRTFNGYHRSDGRVGTANYWLFIPTVFCENRNLDVIREALHNELGYAVTDKYKQFTHHLMMAYCAPVLASDQRERQLQFSSGSSNWVEGTALIAFPSGSSHWVEGLALIR